LNHSKHATAVLVVTPEGIPLVRDPRKPSPVYWKLPGGRSKEGETAKQCAVRELREEVGITLQESDLREVASKDKNGHTMTIFHAELGSLPKLRMVGDEGEEIGVFKASQILDRDDFFPNHLDATWRILEVLD
jgi:8-oxo-dGTP diphosphatase